jgi:hypothetical protein
MTKVRTLKAVQKSGDFLPNSVTIGIYRRDQLHGNILKTFDIINI